MGDENLRECTPKEADTVKESVESMGNPSEGALNRLQKLAPRRLYYGTSL